MKSYEMVETLSAKANVTLEQAKDALEKTNWDILDAAVYIERNGIKKPTQNVNAQPTGGIPNLKKDPQPNVQPNVQQNTQQGYQTSFKQDIHSGYQTPGDGYTQQNGYGNGYNGGSTESNFSFSKFLGEICGTVLSVLQMGVDNSFIVTKGEKQTAKIPVLLFVFLIIFIFPITITLLIVGLFLGYKYSFSGKGIGEGTVNDVMNKAADVAKQIKNDFKEGMNNTKQ